MKEYSNNLPEITLQLKQSTFIKVQIKSSLDAANVFRQVFEETIGIYESMFALYLNRANKTIGWFKISQGGLSGTVVDVRLILKTGIECLASGLIICHNHPSGNVNPSEPDIKITNKLKEGCKILDIQLLDHIILTEDSYSSFADQNLLN